MVVFIVKNIWKTLPFFSYYLSPPSWSWTVLIWLIQPISPTSVLSLNLFPVEYSNSQTYCKKSFFFSKFWILRRINIRIYFNHLVYIFYGMSRHLYSNIDLICIYSNNCRDLKFSDIRKMKVRVSVS